MTKTALTTARSKRSTAAWNSLSSSGCSWIPKADGEWRRRPPAESDSWAPSLDSLGFRCQTQGMSGDIEAATSQGPNLKVDADLEAVRQRCFAHAATLLEAARADLHAGRPHIAYHLALVALEEIGKGEMQWLKRFPNDRTIRDSSAWVEGHADDHEKKLFWALWSFRFTDPKALVRDLREHLDLAKVLHEKRLAALYVSLNPKDPAPEAVVGADEATGLLGLTEARLRVAQTTQPREVTQADADVLAWFLLANEDREKRRLLWSSSSLTKLKELDDVPAWMKWLKDQFDAADAAGRKQAELELARERPQGKEASRDKWRFRFRLVSGSHRMSAKVLKEWNRGVAWIKLYAVDKQPMKLDVDLLGPKAVLAPELWGYGWGVSRVFAAAMNIGTLGFWWWYMPEHVSRFYTSLHDLETHDRLGVERSPRLVIDWKREPLSEADMHNVRKAFLFLVRMKSVAEQQVVEDYLRGVTLLAKSDIFLQFELNIFECFYGVVKTGTRAFGLWDGSTDYREVWLTFVAEIITEEKDRVDYFEAGEAVLKHEVPRMPITLEQVGAMKVLADLFLHQRANERLQAMAEAEGQVDAAGGDDGTRPL